MGHNRRRSCRGKSARLAYVMCTAPFIYLIGRPSQWRPRGTHSKIIQPRTIHRLSSGIIRLPCRCQITLAATQRSSLRAWFLVLNCRAVHKWVAFMRWNFIPRRPGFRSHARCWWQMARATYPPVTCFLLRVVVFFFCCCYHRRALAGEWWASGIFVYVLYLSRRVCFM